MKKLLIVSIMFLLAISVVAAQNGPVDKTAEDAYGKEITIRNTYQNESDNAEKAMVEAKIRQQVKDPIVGLQNAYVHAESPEALERIEANMNRFQNQFQYRYENMNATEVDGNTYLKAERKARFLIFQFNIEDEYVLDEDGNLIAEQRGFLSQLFTRERVVA